MNQTTPGAILPAEMQTMAVAMPQAETTAVAVAEQSRAIVEARYKMALARPRDWDMVRNRLLKDAQRPGFAATAVYAKPMGKKQNDKGEWVQNFVTGPSIRFAEAAIRAMTNIVCETMTVFDDSSRRIVRVSVTDLEANVPWSQDVTIEKTVERSKLKTGETAISSRRNAAGYPVYLLPATDDEILNKQNALISKAVRTLALRLLPGDIQEDAMELCAKTTRTKNAADPDAARQKMLDAFSNLGITPADLKGYLGHDCARFSAEEYEHLRGIGTALRDGETSWREIVDNKERQRQEAEGAKNATPPSANVGNGGGKAGRLAGALSAKTDPATENAAITTATTEGNPTA